MGSFPKLTSLLCVNNPAKSSKKLFALRRSYDLMTCAYQEGDPDEI